MIENLMIFLCRVSLGRGVVGPGLRLVLDARFPRKRTFKRCQQSTAQLELCLSDSMKPSLIVLAAIMAVSSNSTYPAGGTWFDTLKKSFVNVPVDASKDNAIPTGDFLEAAESLTTLFGLLAPSKRITWNWNAIF